MGRLASLEDLDAYTPVTDPRLGDPRAPTAHQHPPDDITGLQALLDAKAAATHTHAQADITGLVTALTGKVGTSDPRLTDARPPTAHSHPISDVTSLQTTLNGKSDTSHTHAELPTPGQKNALAGTQGTPGATNQYVTTQDGRLSDARTPTAHTHPASQIAATGTPSATTYLRGDNTWATPAAGSSPTFAKLTADHAPFTATAPANITGLSFPVTAGTLYTFTAYVIFRIPALTTGARIGLTCPAFTVFSANVNIPFAADGSGAMFHGFLTSSGDSAMSTAVAAINTDYVATISGVILPSASGTLQLQAATEVASSAVTIRNGSHLTYLTV